MSLPSHVRYARTIKVTEDIGENLLVMADGSLPAGATSIPRGVSAHSVVSGESATVNIDGDLIGVSGEAITVGDKLVAANTGRLAVSAGAGYFYAVALSAVSAAGEEFIFQPVHGYTA